MTAGVDWEAAFQAEIAAALAAAGPVRGQARVAFSGSGGAPSAFAVAELCAAGTAAVGAALAACAGRREAQAQAQVDVDRRLAWLWFDRSIAPIGWSTPPSWDPLSGDYAASDGWVRLHCNDAGHRAAALAALELGQDVSPETVASAVAARRAGAVEAAIVAAGGAAAEMRAIADWAAHPQGRAVAAEPLIAWTRTGEVAPSPGASAARAPPLAGLRVLDMTRVLAGPSATRLLAGFGADVLRIDPPFRDEPSLEPEMTLGKRCAGLDLRQADDRARFEALLRTADIFVHGLRGGAIEGLGYDVDRLRALNPGLIDVGLNAYGWSGPWSGRRGFDSLVQMSAGVAAHGKVAAGADRPTPLPVQALDYGAGMLIAAAALQALAVRRDSGVVLSARTSLARVAALLAPSAGPMSRVERSVAAEADWSPGVEETAWGAARRLAPPLRVDGVAPRWLRPAGPIRSARPDWSDGPRAN